MEFEITRVDCIPREKWLICLLSSISVEKQKENEAADKTQKKKIGMFLTRLSYGKLRLICNWRMLVYGLFSSLEQNAEGAIVITLCPSSTDSLLTQEFTVLIQS